jgi:hypothetical protein
MNQTVWLTPDDMPQWDVFVRQHPAGSVYHLSGWKKVLEKSFSHIQGNILAVRDDRSREILAGLPVYTVRSRLTGNRLVSAPFALYCDPLMSSPEHTAMIMPPLFALYERVKASHIEIRTAKPAAVTDARQFKASCFYKHHFLPLDGTPEQLKKRFHKNAVRIPIAKAVSCGLEVRCGKSEQDIACFYRIFSRSRKRQGLPPIPYIYFKSLWDVFGSSGQLTLLLALYKGNPVAVSLLLKFREAVTVEFGCDLIEYRRLCPNHFLDWEAIQLACREGFKLFSFGRTSPRNTGLMTYKERWGTRVEDLVQYFYPESFADTGEEKESSWQYRLIRTICRKAPDPLFQMIGKCIYRHLG